MELKFVETIEGKEWEAEFEAPSDFNLHLERVHGGSLVVSQRGTPTGEYAAAFAKGMYEGQAVIDYDFGALVYPKYIKVVSGSEVVSASVNFNEGGGSGNGSGTINSRAIYYKTVDGIYQDSDIWKNVASSCVSVIKSLRVNPKDNEDKYYIYPSFFVKKDQIVAVCFLPLSKTNFGSDEPGTFNSLEDFFEYAYSDEYPFTVDAFIEKRITEEEFYNLND